MTRENKEILTYMECYTEVTERYIRGIAKPNPNVFVLEKKSHKKILRIIYIHWNVS